MGPSADHERPWQGEVDRRPLEALVAAGVARLGRGEPWLVQPGDADVDAPSGVEILQEQRADRL